MKKRLCLFLDGTWDDATQQHNQLKTTNIWRLSRAVPPTDGEISNIIYYEAGIGSEDGGISSKVNAAVQNAIQGATGIGLADKVNKAYVFIASNWVKGDEIYIVGFSRGAYTARLVAALVGDLGIMTREQLEAFPRIFDEYQKRNSTDQAVREEAEQVIKVARQQANPTAKDVPFLVDMLAVFDTVGSLGLPANFLPPGALNYLGFSDLFLSTRVKHARHAMALNENRRDFNITHWETNPNVSPPAGQTVKQCWFSGSHGDIGGGWEDGDLAYITQFWIVEQIHQTTSLRFDIAYLLSLATPVAGYGKLTPHDSISQNSVWNALAAPHVRDPHPEQHGEFIHASVKEQDLTKWESKKLRGVVEKAKVTELEGVEKLLKEKWETLPKRSATSPAKDNWGVFLKGFANDALYFFTDKEN